MFLSGSRDRTVECALQIKLTFGVIVNLSQSTQS